MRTLMALMLCGLVVLVSGWTSGMHQATPTCATPVNPLWGIDRESGSRVIRAVQIPGPSGTALYTRWCGPATARVHLDGASFLLRSGHCIGKPTSYFVRVGLMANPPARPAKWVGLFIRNRRAAVDGGTVRLEDTAANFSYANIQLGGPRLEIASGKITIGRSMRDGTFAFRLQDATRVTGSWTCGASA